MSSSRDDTSHGRPTTAPTSDRGDGHLTRHGSFDNIVVMDGVWRLVDAIEGWIDRHRLVRAVLIALVCVLGTALVWWLYVME
jgi:hypothetical protein